MRCNAIIVNYRCASDTQAAVASILAQAPDCLIIVVDNSEDEVEAQRLKSVLPAHVHLLVTPCNLGFAAACNLAWRECQGDYVLLLNPDARLLPQTFTLLVEAMTKNPRLAAVAPTTWWDEDRLWLLPTLLPETLKQWLINAVARRWPTSVGQWMAMRWLDWQQSLHWGYAPKRVHFLSAAVLLLRRAAIDRPEGLFDERFFMYYEDADLSRHLIDRGYELALIPQAHAVHHWRNSLAKSKLMQASAECYIAKHYAGSSWLLNLLEHRACPALGLRQPPPEVFTTYIQWHTWLDGARIVCISPTDLGFPAIFRPAGREGLPASEALWQRLDTGRYRILVEVNGHRHWMNFVKSDPMS